MFLVAVTVIEFSQGAESNESSKANQPNVLFIAIDDMNDWVGFLGGPPTSQNAEHGSPGQTGVLTSQTLIALHRPVLHAGWGCYSVSNPFTPAFIRFMITKKSHRKYWANTQVCPNTSAITDINRMGQAKYFMAPRNWPVIGMII